jgi:RsiW-degrading membrane proteinase PrsW (M82 family)
MEELFFEVTLAVIPCIAIALGVYLWDQHRPEPFWLVAISFLLGGLAFGLNLLIGWYPNHFYQGGEETIFQKAVHVFLVIAIPEELCKFIMVLLLMRFTRSNFTEPIDGIVYTVMVGMGFACVENLIYVLEHGAGSGILRMFSAIPAHAMLGIIMGFHLGIARFTRRKWKQFLALGLIIPVGMHGMYNLFLYLHFIQGMWIGAGIGMLISLYFCLQSIKIHQRFSPYNPHNPRYRHLHNKENPSLEGIDTKNTL